jgi:hypothetical protein
MVAVKNYSRLILDMDDDGGGGGGNGGRNIGKSCGNMIIGKSTLAAVYALFIKILSLAMLRSRAWSTHVVVTGMMLRPIDLPVTSNDYRGRVFSPRNGMEAEDDRYLQRYRCQRQMRERGVSFEKSRFTVSLKIQTAETS